MRTVPPTKVTSITADELAEQLRAFEAEHRVNADNWTDALGTAGVLRETSEFFEICALYALRGRTGASGFFPPQTPIT